MTTEYKSIPISGNLLIFLKHFIVSYIIITILASAIIVPIRKPVYRNYASALSKPAQSNLKEYGFDIFDNNPRHIPPEAFPNFTERDKAAVGKLNKINDWFEKPMLKLVANVGSTTWPLSLLYAVWAHVRLRKRTTRR